MADEKEKSLSGGEKIAPPNDGRMDKKENDRATAPDNTGAGKGSGLAGPIILGLIISVAGNAALAIHPMFRGSQDHQLAAMILGMYLAIPVIILGALSLVAGRMSGSERFLSVGRVGLVVGICLVSMWISLPIGNALLNSDVEEAKNFCMSLMEEGIVAPDARGNYPSSINEKIGDKKLPRLLPERFYTGGSDRFMFYIEDPRDAALQHVYRSEKKSWEP